MKESTTNFRKGSLGVFKVCYEFVPPLLSEGLCWVAKIIVVVDFRFKEKPAKRNNKPFTHMGGCVV